MTQLFLSTSISFALTLSNDYVETVVTKVASLTRTLNTVTDYCDCLIFEDFTGFFKGEFLTCHYLFDNATKIAVTMGVDEIDKRF